MQAAGVTPPILNLKSLAPGRAQGYPDQDRFHSLLQERILSRGWGNSSSKAMNSSSLRQQVRQARPASSSSTSPVLQDRYNSNSMRSSMIQEAQGRASRLTAEARSRADRLSGKSPKDSPALAAAVVQPNTEMPAPLKRLTEFLNQQPEQTLKVSPDHLQELKDFLQKAGLPAAQVDRLLNSDNFQTKGLTTQDVQAAWQEACQNSPQQTLAANIPPALKGLMELLNQQPGQALKVSPGYLQELKDFLQKAGLPAAPVERLLNSDSFQTKGLTAQDVQAAWQEACQNSSQQALAAQLSQATSSQLANATVNLDMPPALKGLTAFLNQQPGQALKVPPDRLPQVQAFLLNAGIPAEQVENLLNSPQVQEQGLTAANVQAAWQKGVQNSLKQALAASGSQLGSVQNLTSQADYQHLWQNLTIPPQALGDLRLELQKLGVPPESLTGLNQQNFPNGIPLTQVWELLQQGAKSSSPATANAAVNVNSALDSTPLLDGGKDLGKWRQLLTQAGMDPEVAQTLTSGPNPTNRGELRAGLMQMAPSSTSQDQIPQPLYLPQSVRVRQVPLLEQTGTGPGQGGGNGNLGQNLGAPPQAQAANLAGTTDLNNFLAYLSNNSTLQADQTGVPGAAGGPAPSVNSYLLTPEAREALWSQVQSGVLGNLRPGENQVTLTLNPPDLGKVNLTLNLKGEMVEVTAITTHSAVAEAATAGVQQLAQALNQQGLILTQFRFHHQDEAQGQPSLNFSQTPGDQRQAGKKEADKWERPATPRRQRWAGRGSIDCFA